MSSWSSAAAVVRSACGPKSSCFGGKLTGGRQVGAGGAVQNVVFFLVRLADAEVDDGPVRALFGVFGGPGC
jgi:hypothetical protein